MGYWNRWLEYFRPPPIASADALEIFLQERASLIAQKCAIDYVRGKTGLASYALFTEKPFLDAMEVCRWETFVAALGDLSILAEGVLRPHAPADQQPRLRSSLLGLYSEILASLPVPIYRPQGWEDVIEAFKARWREVDSKPPQQALDVADHSAKRLFDTLPIHLNMRSLDEPVVYGAVRFRMIAVRQEMQRRFALAALARELAA
jgi:hypothetical protein